MTPARRIGFLNSFAQLNTRRTERQEQKQIGPVLDAAGAEVEAVQQDLLRAPCRATSTALLPGGGLRQVAAAAVIGLLLTSCTTPPSQYHNVVQQPFALRETSATLDLSARSSGEMSRIVAQFAAERPNNGSYFVVTADAESARRVAVALRSAGVRNADMRLVTAAQATSVVRHDVAATVPTCIGAPRSMLGFGVIDDGYTHDNANSSLLGCAIQRNIAAMVDDPRTLGVAEPASPREGARSAEIYGRWVRGEPTESKAILPSPRTATTGADNGAK